MRLVVTLLLTISLPLFAERSYYLSNKSGMILEEIEAGEGGEFYVAKDEDLENWRYLYKFYENGLEVKEREEFYNDNFQEIEKIIYIEDESRVVELFSNHLISSVETYSKDTLTEISRYLYNLERELIEVDVVDGEGNPLYSDKYYRNIDGSLRKLIRSSEDGYYNQWFYKKGVIIEHWLVEGETSTRSQYNSDGDVLYITQYVAEEVTSKESFSYSDQGFLMSSSKITGNESIEKRYNSDGNVIELRNLNDGILLKKSHYEYRNTLLVKESVTGHGKREDYIYEYNDEEEVSTIVYYLNGQLKRVKIIESEDSEIYEYYRDEVIFLKEFFFQGERIQRDLYLDGKLFKSESNNE